MGECRLGGVWKNGPIRWFCARQVIQTWPLGRGRELDEGGLSRGSDEGEDRSRLVEARGGWAVYEVLMQLWGIACSCAGGQGVDMLMRWEAQENASGIWKYEVIARCC